MLVPSQIFRAAQKGDAKKVESWLSSIPRFDRDSKSDESDDGLSLVECSLLTISTQSCQLDVMRLLFAHGASANATDHHGWAPLHIAAEIGDDGHDPTEVLLDHGADVDARIEGAHHFGRTALHVAAKTGSLRTIRLLLARGANPGLRETSSADVRAFGLQGDDAEGTAVRRSQFHVARFLKDVRCNGGWKSFARYPRRRLNDLRVLCESGRATAPSWTPGSHHLDIQRLFKLPKEIFWLVLTFWRCEKHYYYDNYECTWACDM